jgi:hypothetical protein
MHVLELHSTLKTRTPTTTRKRNFTSRVVPLREEVPSLAVLASVVFSRKVTDAFTVSSQPWKRKREISH